ncbi:MAG: aminotransferase class I/II-fold pyridoxal phosphate-dependent enzyme [Patescibacteria group bacterium]
MFETDLQLESSATMVMNNMAMEKKAHGERVYNLSAGEPILPAHPAIAKAAREAIEQGKTLYPPVAGIPELRRVAAQWMRNQYGTRYEVANTLVTCGGKFAIFSALQAFIKPGDEVIIIAPYYVSYPSIIRLFGGIPKIVHTDPAHWKATADQIEAVCTNKTRMLILNNGSNPTGVLYSRQELKVILAVAKKHNLMTISDEVYSALVYEGEYVSAGSFPEFHDNLLLVQSCSKHFAMTGWRVGIVFGPEQAIKILANIQGQSTTGTSSVSQWAAVAAFTNADEISSTVREAMRKRRDTFVKTFIELFSCSLPSPASALYSFIPLSSFGTAEKSSVVFCERMMREANVALVPGLAFGAEGYARASFGASESELVEALRALT